MQINDYNNLPEPTSEYEQKVIDFCQNWLNEKKEFIIKTSGSTGEPKLIQLTRNQMIASAELTGKTFGLVSGDSALVCLNIEYIAGMMMLVRGMVWELKLTIIEPSGNPFENLEKFNFDFFAFVPLQLDKILERKRNIDLKIGDFPVIPTKEGTDNKMSKSSFLEKSDSSLLRRDDKNLYFKSLEILNKAKAIIVGGASVNKVLEQKIQTLSAPVFSTYGMTETVSHIAIKRLNGNNKTENFQVLESVKIGIDTRNCLNIIAESSNNELIQTNDIVEIINEKEFKLIGRFDNIINSGGVKIQLEKIEKLIENEIQIFEPKRYFAYGIPDEKLGQKLVLVVETDIIDEKMKELFLQKIRLILPKYEIPKEIFFVKLFEETQTGKIDKKTTISLLSTTDFSL